MLQFSGKMQKTLLRKETNSMRKKKTIWKKTISVVLSLVMAAGLLPAISKPLTVEAAGDMTTAFATRDELIDNVFNLDGTGIVQSINFGHGGSSGEDHQLWYIAGYDSNADNLVLMCDPTMPLSRTDMNFCYSYPDPTFAVSDSRGLGIDTCTYKGKAPEKVGMSHYGLSQIRQELKDIEKDTEVFSKGEQGLMEDTTIYTYDRLNNEYYTTTDKLYLAHAPSDYFSNRYLVVGKNSERFPDRGLKINYNDSPIYANCGIWLRTPYTGGDNKAMLCKFAWRGIQEESANSGKHGVVPALALDLSSVLFASNVGDPNGVMTLRLDDNSYGNIVSTVTNTPDEITVTKSRRDAGKLYLWVVESVEGGLFTYSKEIDQNTTVKASDITYGPTENPMSPESFSNCRVWIETTVDNVAYAKLSGTVAAPTASVAAGTYAANQSITLSTATPGAAIHYTTDGSTPTFRSPEYTGPISVTGKEGESVTTTIKAIAVMEDESLWDSSVSTFKYVINLPHTHSWSSAWTSDSSGHWHECTKGNCTVTANSQKGSYAAHTEDGGTITTQPTAASAGVKTYKCSVCGYVMRTETIPATGGGTGAADVPPETAAKIQTMAKELDVSADTLKITDKTVTARKTDGDITGSSFVKIQARASKTTSKSVKLTWNRVKGADGYLVYGNRCNSGGKKYSYKLLKTITKGTTKTYTQSKLKKGTSYKYMVCAYKLVDGQKVTIAASKTIHAVTDGGKYGNAKSVKVNKTKVSIKKGKSYTIKASEVKKSKKLQKHRSLSYESSNTKIATVSKKGVIKAKAKGSCTIYVYAQNGMYKTVKVTVK